MIEPKIAKWNWNTETLQRTCSECGGIEFEVDPPSPEHEGLKNFAVEQIEMSIPDMSFYEGKIAKAKPDAEEWLKAKIELCTDSIEHCQKMIQKEYENCESRNRWVSDLRESLEA